MFGRKKPEPPAIVPAAPGPTPQAPVLEFSDQLLGLRRGASSLKKMSDLDFSDLGAPKVKHDGEWKSLELYTTEVTLVLTNFTFRAGWYQGWGRSEPGEKHWYERLLASAQIELPNGDLLLTFYDWGDSDYRPESGARYSVDVAEFDNTSIIIDSDFERKAGLGREKRSLEDYFQGSPAKLFPTPKDADDWIKAEVMVYSDNKYLYKDQIDAKGGRPQTYTWPDIVFSRNEYREYEDDPNPGFYGSSINVPEDVYTGLRRAIVDFKDGARVTVRARMELYGLGVRDYSPAPFPPAAELSIVPRAAQLAGSLMELKLVWDDEVRPISSPGPSWTGTERDDERESRQLSGRQRYAANRSRTHSE